ncbi:hypothetical protein EZV62_020789 [Acer yangbiense]|uniref:Uncharacterized protein n=1 Tax=Acer yangbiense TaxID=1000413 RepID=A0A5C7HEF7_9ROSI|nr:hypothetical protein EZV62_020789 [Acer yangbiense]
MSFFIFLYFSFLLFLFHPASSRQPTCHESERSALLRFKESFSIKKSISVDPSAYCKTELWNLEEDSDCCSWDGVECNEDTGYVIKLDLGSSCLYGFIDSTNTLFNLVHLQWLSLADNHFNSSKIPSEIKNLSNLSHLNLSYSVFSGQIPSEILELSKLESLDLSGYNRLELQQPGLESLVRKLTNLRVLDLGRVNISSSLSHVLTDLSSLNFLSLANCELKGTIPSSLGNLTNLVYLDLSSNYFGGTPALFSGTIWPSLDNLSNLAHLDMRGCNLSGRDPASSLSNLTQLTYLDLSQNNFSSPSSLLSWISKNTKLTHLSLSYISNLSGQDPASSLSNLNQLYYLDLYNNNIGGGEGSESSFAFGWKVVAIGYACGLIIGVVVGHIFCTKKYECVEEALRMHPAGHLLPRKARETCEICGYTIPAKAKVLINVYAIGRDPKSWKDPENFRPERFEGSSIDFRGNNFELLLFGSGRRMCPGISFAISNIELE